jgi:hypothetical protein
MYTCITIKYVTLADNNWWNYGTEVGESVGDQKMETMMMNASTTTITTATAHTDHTIIQYHDSSARTCHEYPHYKQSTTQQTRTVARQQDSKTSFFSE